MSVESSSHFASFAADAQIYLDFPTDVITFGVEYKYFYNTAYPANGKSVVYMQGSGGRSPPSDSHTIITALTEAGYGVFSPGWSVKPYDPYRYNYGSVSQPQVMHRLMKISLILETMLNATDPHAPSSTDFVVLGRSLGATASLAWAARYHDPALSFQPNLKGIIADGATSGGLGNLSWNDMNRTIAEMSQLIALNKVPEKTLIVYGAEDEYAPSDYYQRLRVVLPDETRMVHVPESSHSWMNQSLENAAIAVRWVDQLIAGDVITLVDGVTPAIAGAGGIVGGAEGPDYPADATACETGPPGPRGQRGPQGIQGPEGPIGPEGGPIGPTGPEGPVGPIGPAGPEGPEGPEGPVGPTGPQGIRGPHGYDGSEGPRGYRGYTGPAGPEGPRGPRGDDGDQGPEGPAGPEGPEGPKGLLGATFASNFYSSSSAGLSDTSSGDYFYVSSGDEVIRYENSSGSAVEIERYPTIAAVGNYLPDLVNQVTSDWNSLSVSGTYRNGNSAATGAPAAVANLLLQHIEGFSPRAAQICYDTWYGRQWRRTRSSSNVWSDWVQIDPATVGNYLPDLVNQVTSDWNSLSVSGTYRSGNSAATGAPTSTISNLLLQHIEGFSPRAAQICYDTWHDRQWRRTRNSSNVWSDWTEMDFSGPDLSGVGETVYTSNLNSLNATGTYRSDGATGQPVALTHTVTHHIEGAGGRGYQTAHWGLYEPALGDDEPRAVSASRFRLSDGTWSNWQRSIDLGMPRREVDAGDDQSFTSASAVHIRRPMSDYYRINMGSIYSTAEDLNSLYRQLVVDFPDYVSEEQIGTDALGNPIWSLTFEPDNVIGNRSGYPSGALELPKLCVTSGVHANERVAMVATLAAMDSLCRHWRDDEMLSWLRWNAKIVLVPLVNPSGVNAGNTRTNSNGVDINRNFPTRWSELDTNPGASAGSELETQALLSWVNSHIDTRVVIDHHSHGNAGYPIWSLVNAAELDVVERILREQHAWARREVLHEEGNVARYAISPLKGGMFATHAQESMGARAQVLECPEPSLPEMSGITARGQRLMNAKTLTRSLYEWSRVKL